MGDITKNFSYAEFEASATAKAKGIDNVAPAGVRSALASLVGNILQPLRDDLGVVVKVNSGYRCEELNALVGGEEKSQHPKGEAADVYSPFYTPLHIARRIVALQLPFDQLILYPTFVHVSHKLKGKQRGQILYNRRYSGEKI